MSALWRLLTTRRCLACDRHTARWGERHGIGGSFCSEECHENAWGEFMGTWTKPATNGEPA